MKKNEIWGSGLSPFFVPDDFLPSHPTVKEDLKTEVLIIGGGLSGLLCAYELCKAGREVTVVTENTVADGATRFSAGILFGDGGPELLRLKQTLGLRAGVEWYRTAGAALSQLEKILSDTGSRCDFTPRESFYYTSLPKSVSALREEYFLRHHMGLNCRWLGAEECAERFSFPCAGGILSRAGATFNPVKFGRDLTDWITLHGGAVFEGSRVESIERGDGEYRCRCNGYVLRAKKIVDARGGEVLRKRPALGQRVTVFSIVTEPISVFRGWPEECLIKSRDEFSYLRTTPDGRILFSGEASTALSPEGKIGSLDASPLCRVKYRNLEEDLQEMFFGIPRVRKEYGFCQSLVIPKGGLPYVGRDPQWEGVYYLYAFGEGGLAGAILGSAWIYRMMESPTAQCPAFLNLP
ncbi:MAG: FAD-binding oxidoreductase [Clostridia bacterium]|nr:FAD-binding oxidoreductase [Clostridia bacterium]